MARAFGSYPHPVLATGLGDVDSVLEVQRASIAIKVDEVQIRFDLILDDPYFQEMLGMAQLAVKARIRSGAAMSVLSVAAKEQLHLGDRRHYSVSFDQSELRGRCTFDILLVATQRIDDYRPPRMSLDFGDAQFQLEQGDVVGVALQIPIDIEKNYDPLNPPLDSCFRFERDNTLSAGFKLDVTTSDHQVTVKMSADVFDRFAVQSSRPAVQIALVMLPALIAALDLIEASNGTYEGLDWHTAITNLAAVHSNGDTDNYVIAQRILEDPLLRALKALDDAEWGDD